MTDLTTSDYGTFSEWTIPEPDSPLTHGWFDTITEGVARLITCGWLYYPKSDTTYSATHTATACSNFSLPPIVKVYEAYQLSSGTIFSDFMYSVPHYPTSGVGTSKVYFISREWGAADGFVVNSAGYSAPVGYETMFQTVVLAWGK